VTFLYGFEFSFLWWLLITDIEHILTNHLTSFISSFEKCIFKTITLFKVRLFEFAEFLDFLLYSLYQPLFRYSGKYFHPFCRLSLHSYLFPLIAEAFFPYFLLLCWGYIVAFTKVLTMYKMYNSWINPLLHSPYPHSWNSFKGSHFSIYIHVHSFCTTFTLQHWLM
jgi:hypothetical protein